MPDQRLGLTFYDVAELSDAIAAAVLVLSLEPDVPGVIAEFAVVPIPECLRAKGNAKRLQFEFDKINEIPGMLVRLENSFGSLLGDFDPLDRLSWRAMLEGPKGSPYEGGRFWFDVEFTGDYPFHPPSIVMTTKIYHCNWDDQGECHAEVFYTKRIEAADEQQVVFNVKMITGITLRLRMSRKARMNEVKRRLAEHEPIYDDGNYTLFFAGKPIQSFRTLEWCNVQNDSTLQTVFRKSSKGMFRDAWNPSILVKDVLQKLRGLMLNPQLETDDPADSPIGRPKIADKLRSNPEQHRRTAEQWTTMFATNGNSKTGYSPR